MLYEKPLNSFQQLMREAQILDVDGGIRVEGSYSSKKCLVFLTKAEKGYVVTIYSTKKEGKLSIPDRRLLIKTVSDDDGLKDLLEKVVKKPVKAFSY